MMTISTKPVQQWNTLLTSLQDDLKPAKGKYNSPRFKRFCRGHLGSPSQVDAFNEQLQSVFNRSNGKGKKVLDAGCGCGLYSIFFGLHGAKEVTGVDLDPEFSDVFKKLLLEIPSFKNITLKCGDIFDLDEEDGTFDVGICINAISHIREPYSFLCEVKRLLREGGTFYILDGNNKLSLYVQIHNKITWWRLRGWLKEQREYVIRSHFPSLDNVTVSKLVGKTEGMRLDEILSAVQEFLTTGEITVRPAFSRCKPTEKGNFEFEHNPLQLKKQLVQDFGFEARLIRPFFPRAPIYPQDRPPSILRWVAWYAWRCLSCLYPLSLIILPRFEIVATCHK